jgi:hypothetical protein
MDFTDEEQAQLVEVCKQLGAKPKFDTKEDFVKWMKEYVQMEAAENIPDVKPVVPAEHFMKKELLPKIPIFSGSTPAKSDHVPFEVWHYELQCLIKQKRFSEQAILNAARLSLRGDASKVAVRLGTDVTTGQLVEKMKHLYGTIDSGEELLARFYSATQTPTETVVEWSCRLEDLMAPAIQAGHFTRETSQEPLRNKFWGGLRHPLKELSSHKFDRIEIYEDLLVEVRKIEKSFETEQTAKTTKQAKQHLHQSSDSASASESTASVEASSDAVTLQQLQSQLSELAAQVNQLSTRRPPKCWRCGKIGHVQSVCRNTSLPLNQFRPTARGNCWPWNPKPQKD